MQKKNLKKQRIFFFHYHHAEDQYDEVLGMYFGYYENNENGEDRLYFYEKGICWKKPQEDLIIFYNQINSIQLEDGKASLALLIGLKNNTSIRLPVQGKKGKFVDSLLIYGFLSNVAFRVYKTEST